MDTNDIEKLYEEIKKIKRCIVVVAKVITAYHPRFDVLNEILKIIESDNNE